MLLVQWIRLLRFKFLCCESQHSSNERLEHPKQWRCDHQRDGNRVEQEISAVEDQQTARLAHPSSSSTEQKSAQQRDTTDAKRIDGSYPTILYCSFSETVYEL